jgi:hypothetical protein
VETVAKRLWDLWASLREEMSLLLLPRSFGCNFNSKPLGDRKNLKRLGLEITVGF